MFGAKLADVNPMLLNREPRLELDWLDMVSSYSTRCSLQWWLFIYSNHIQLLIRWDWEGRCSLRGCCHSPLHFRLSSWTPRSSPELGVSAVLRRHGRNLRASFRRRNAESFRRGAGDTQRGEDWFHVGSAGGVFFFPYIGNNNPNWRTHIFQRCWNHQPDMEVLSFNPRFPSSNFFAQGNNDSIWWNYNDVSTISPKMTMTLFQHVSAWWIAAGNSPRLATSGI